jgi:hypothetical protein
LLVQCFNDIKKISSEDLAFVFRKREWPVNTHEENLAKVLEFCELEPWFDCCEPVNSLNTGLLNFLLLKRLHRRIMATNEKSNRTGDSNYEGLSRFACEYAYVVGARMVCSMAEVASLVNIPLIRAATRGVGPEVERHIVDYLTVPLSSENSAFPMFSQNLFSSTEMLGTVNDNDEEFEIFGETRKRKVNSVPAGISLRGLAMFQGKAILAADGVLTSHLGDGSKAGLFKRNSC